MQKQLINENLNQKVIKQELILTDSKKILNKGKKKSFYNKLKNSSNPLNQKQTSSDLQDQNSQDDSAVSLQDNMLDQHIFCLRYVFSKIEKTYFISKSLNFQFLLDGNYLQSMEMGLSEYLQVQKQFQQEPCFSTFLTIISEDSKLNEFLNWIYDTAPQYFLPELIIIFQKVVLSFQALKLRYLSQPQLVSLASNLSFLEHIYGDKKLAIFNYSNYKQDLESQESIQKGTVPHLMKFYLLTLLLVIQNYFFHPEYQSLKKIVNQQVKQRYEKIKTFKNIASKKIKKIRPTVQCL